MKNPEEQKATDQKTQKTTYKSNVKHTSDGEMPDADSLSSDKEQTRSDVEAAYEAAPKASAREERIPESQGDLADRAEEEIENEIKGKIDRIREESRIPMRDRH
jgi:hypothetical protein